MIFECGSCKKKYKYDESKLGDKSSVKAKCPNCGSIIEIQNPSYIESITQVSREKLSPSMEEEIGEQTIAAGKASSTGLLKMPEGKKLSLAVIQGNQVGEVFKVIKPRTIIGRSEP